MLDRRHQLEHGDDEGDEAADRAAAWPLCQSAATITAASAHEASTWVIGVIVEAATIDFIDRRRSWLLTRSKRDACDASAPCRRTLRQARTFSSTT